MPITKQLLQLGRSAHAHYVMRLEKERKEKEEAQKQLTLQREQALQMEAQKRQLREKKDLQCEEKELERKERAQQDSMEVGDTILKEANAKLQAALKNKDFNEVSVAQAMIEAAQKKISTANTGMQQASEQQRSVSKRKQSIINTFLSQPSDPKSKKS